MQLASGRAGLEPTSDSRAFRIHLYHPVEFFPVIQDPLEWSN